MFYELAVPCFAPVQTGSRRTNFGGKLQVDYVGKKPSGYVNSLAANSKPGKMKESFDNNIE